MKVLQCLAAATLAIASCAAQAEVYVYHGNAFEFDSIGTSPVVATFDFDFAHSDMAQYDTYAFKSWDVRAGSIHLSSANGDLLSNRFSFDGSRNVTGWFFNAGKPSEDYADGNIQSISENYSFFAPNIAHDIVLAGDPLQSASIYGNQGTWTTVSPVPEPDIAVLVAAGGITCALLRRRQKRAAA